MELDRYLELVKKTPEQIREELTPSATERVKRSLVLSKLTEEENIEVGETDIDDEIDRLVSGASAGNAEQVERYRAIFRSEEARSSISRSLLTRKTLDRLTEITSQDGAAPAAKKSKSKKAAAEAPEAEPEAAIASGSPSEKDGETQEAS
jgi:FKBP-type peptidyl-prolyl cis-trans isomerase (trigger factor)